jgi:hypothetical protein
MTIIEAYQQLLEFFNENDSFSIDENRKAIIPISVNQEKDDAVIICALKEMEKAGILRTTSVNNKDFWILFRSIESFPQTLEIGGLLCAGIASVINNACDVLENNSEKCDPKNITEKDLKNLIYLASKLSPEDLKK